MKKYIIRIAIVAVVLLIAAVVVIALSLDSIIKKGVETVGPQITRTELKLDGVSISILSGSGTLKGFLLGNPEGFKTTAAIKAGEVSLGVQPGSVLSDKVHVTHVKVINPEITFEGTLGTKNNLSKILENVEAATGGGGTNATPSAPAPANSGAAKKLQVDDFLISGAANDKVVVEWDVYRYVPIKGEKPGVVLYGISRRAYGETDGRAFLTGLKDQRPNTIKTLARFDVPEIKPKP